MDSPSLTGKSRASGSARGISRALVLAVVLFALAPQVSFGAVVYSQTNATILNSGVTPIIYTSSETGIATSTVVLGDFKVNASSTGVYVHLVKNTYWPDYITHACRSSLIVDDIGNVVRTGLVMTPKLAGDCDFLPSDIFRVYLYGFGGASVNVDSWYSNAGSNPTYAVLYSVSLPSISLTYPVASSTITDFTEWEVFWQNASTTGTYLQPYVQYSASSTQLTNCTGTGSCTGVNLSGGAMFSDENLIAYVSKSAPLNNGVWYARAGIKNWQDNSVATSSIVNFTIDPNALVSATSTQQFGTPAPLVCEIWNISCHLKNAFIWLFYPSQASLDQFDTLTLENSVPFSYVYDMPTVFSELLGSSATTTMEIKVNGLHFVPNASSSVTFISSSMISAVPFANTLRTLMGYILWFLFALLVYRQVIKVHDK